MKVIVPIFEDNGINRYHTGIIMLPEEVNDYLDGRLDTLYAEYREKIGISEHMEPTFADWLIAKGIGEVPPMAVCYAVVNW
jgi:hypothetical protein